ncbi:hypothetical protein HYU16_03015 [Candidatus Woesearchaeota archaeon]|nr:hypothetical protein [Candidatus Woesearchaeota archaeon]
MSRPSRYISSEAAVPKETPVIAYGRVLYTLTPTRSPSELKPKIEPSELDDLIRGLPFEERARLPRNGPVATLAEYFGLDWKNYFTRDDLRIFIVDNGIRSSTKLFRGHHKIWQLARSMRITVKEVWAEAGKDPDLDALVEAPAPARGHATPPYEVLYASSGRTIGGTTLP